MGLREASEQQSAIAEAIEANLEVLDLNQEIELTPYSRVVLPLDGYVFWLPKGSKIKVKGALHFMDELVQNEDETIDDATVTFTTRERVVEFAEAPINTIYVGRQGKFRYSFFRQQGFLQASRHWHYQGRVVTPVMTAQLIDDPSRLDPTQVVVSNSLPLWLALNDYVSPIYGGFSNSVMLYPSHVIPPNLEPPYCAVHIPPESTRAEQGVPLISQVIDIVNGEPVTVRQHQQLAADRVRLTVFGLQNLAAQAFFDSILEVMQTAGQMGLKNMPIPADGKRGQAGLQAIAMQKSIEFDISYNQYAAWQTALRTITSASVTLLQGT